jgi:hypothetical protein
VHAHNRLIVRKAFLDMVALVFSKVALVPYLIETCILPHGSENSPSLWDWLESFQGELAKRVLHWPKHHSNTAATLAVGLQSLKSRILGRLSAKYFG